MTEFVSDPITPHPRRFDTAAMGRGEPGLPEGFTWHGVTYRVTERLDAWKHSQREGGGAQGELYLRRHYYRLRMSDGSIWTVYFTRRPASTGPVGARWFLYTIDTGEAPAAQ